MATFNLDEFNVEWNHYGRPQKIRGDIILPKAASIESAIFEFLKLNALELQFNFDPSSLRLVHKADTPTRIVLRYEQVIDDIPVFNSYVIVQADHNNKIKQLDFNHVNEVRMLYDSKQKKISEKEAYNLALKSLENVTLRGNKMDPSLIYYPSDNGLYLAYLILILTQNPMHDWQIIVDAITGRILHKEDIIKSMPDGSGFVFDPNPVVTANDNTLRQPTATVAAGCGYAGSAVATLDGQRVTRTLKDLTLAAGVHSLDGPYAKIINISDPVSSIPTEATATAFTYLSSDEKFGAVHCYYHIDTIQRYIQSLGITTGNNRKTQCDPAVNGFSAYYSSIDKSLHMGISRPCHPDKSQEGDAIIHEYGHAIQDNQVPGWGVTNPVTFKQETGAMGEGFGDTLACVFFANFGNQFQRETFEDWAYVENGASGLRRVDGTKVYPTDWSSEVHNDGEIWSAALWNIYRAIGGDSLTLANREAARDSLLKSLILSHHLLAKDASMPDGAEAIMNQHAELDDYRGKYLMEMLNSFHDRGLLKCSASADLWMHDAPSDTGAEPFSGPTFWESPDLWVRNADDNGTIQQDPEFGQDNYFYARVTNRGTVTARAFVVTFNVKPWAGIQFVYPGDFIPFISAACGFNLAPGASTIVKAKWPASLIPPKDTHACLLGQVYMPTDTTPAGVHVWDKNNLAQKNMTVVDAIPGDTIYARFQVGNIYERITNLYNIEVVRPPRWENIRVSLMSINNFETKKLFNSSLRWKPAEVISQNENFPTLRFKEYTSLELYNNKCSSIPLRFNFSPGSSIAYGNYMKEETKQVEFKNNARLVESSHNTEIELNEGRVAGLPVVIEPGMQLSCALKIIVPEDATPGESLLLRVAQRNVNGEIIGGISIQINVKNKNREKVSRSQTNKKWQL